MRIKKVNQTVATVGQIVNEASDSTVDTYSCDYIDDHKLDKFSDWISFTPTLANCTATYTTQYGYFKYLDENTIYGAIVVRGEITAVDSNPYARIKLNMTNVPTSLAWRCMCILKEAAFCVNETPFSADMSYDSTLGHNIGIESQSSGGTGACTWKTTNNFYISAQFIMILS